MSEQIQKRDPLSLKVVAVGVFSLCEAYGVTLGPNTPRVFLEAMTGLVTDQEFTAVVKTALETEERWCSPAVLLRIARELREDAREQEADEERRRQRDEQRWCDAPISSSENCGLRIGHEGACA